MSANRFRNLILFFSLVFLAVSAGAQPSGENLGSKLWGPSIFDVSPTSRVVGKAAASGSSCSDQTTSRESCNNNVQFLCKCEVEGQEPTYEPSAGGCDEERGCHRMATTAMGITELCEAVDQLTPEPASCHEGCTDQGVRSSSEATSKCCKVEKTRACSSKPESCGDGNCDAPCETCSNCEADCGPCEPDDCAAKGSGSCESCNYDGLCDGNEDCASCPSDCPSCETCGDAICDGSEDCYSCDTDCGPCEPTCGDAMCDSGEDCSTCEIDCGSCEPTCGDYICDGSEDCYSCDIDCGPCEPTCGDGMCDSGEDCYSCDIDCGSCEPTCGDGMCDPGEDCTSCEIDCGCSSGDANRPAGTPAGLRGNEAQRSVSGDRAAVGHA